MFEYNKIRNYERPYVIAEIGANHNGDMELEVGICQIAAICEIEKRKRESPQKYFHPPS